MTAPSPTAGVANSAYQLGELPNDEPPFLDAESMRDPEYFRQIPDGALSHALRAGAVFATAEQAATARQEWQEAHPTTNTPGDTQ